MQLENFESYWNGFVPYALSCGEKLINNFLMEK